MEALRSLGRAFALSSLSRHISEAFKPRPPAPAPAANWRKPRRPEFTLEAMEPRLLLSADVNYPAVSAATDVTLRVIDDADPGLKIQLTETAGGSVLFTGAIAQNENVVNVTRGASGSIFADTIRVDLASFALLDPNGDALTINFDFQGQDLFKDKVILGSGSLDFGLTVRSNTDIEVPATTNITLTDADDDLGLQVATVSTGFLNNLATDAEAAFFTGVVGDIDYEFDFLADVDADLDIRGTLNARNVQLGASATIDIDNAGLGLGSLQLAFIYANSSANVDIGAGAQINATGDLGVHALSNLRAIASLSALAGEDAGEADAALSAVILFSDAVAQVRADADISAAGAFDLIADNIAIGGALADGSAADSGATLALAVLDSSTRASIGGSATVTAGSVTVGASSQNTLTALAKATSGGAEDDGSAGTGSASQKALLDNDAATSSGSVSLAGAVAVGTLLSNTEAWVDTTGSLSTTGALDVSATSANAASTLADGSSTAEGSTGLGIAVAIGVDLLDNHAWVDGSGLSAGGLNVAALTGDRTLGFKLADVNAVDDTLLLAGGAHGLRTGDEVIYANTGGAADEIGTLDEGTHYFVAVQSDGRIKLYDSRADAIAGTATGLVNIAAGGAAAGHSFKTVAKLNRFDVTAIAGAGGADTGVAGALALGVVISDTSATVREGTTVTITGGGDVTVTSDNRVESSVKASGKQEGGGGTGVGASFALNVTETDTDAAFRDGATVTGAVDVSVSATSASAVATTAEGGAAGDTAVTPVIAITVSDNETLAQLGTLGGAMTVGDELKVAAAHEGSVKTIAEGATESGGTGVGISLALSIGTDLAAATTARSLAAGGAIGLSARNVSGNSGRAKAGVAGGSNDAPEEGSEDAEEGGVNKKVADARDFAGARKGGKGDSTTPSTEGASAEGEGGAKVQVAGAAAITVTSATSRAKVNDGLAITAGNAIGVTDGTLTLKSEANSDSEAIADASTVQEGEAGSGGTGIGVAVAVNVANVVNEALLGNGTVTADGVVVRALMAEVDGDSKHAFKAEATSGASGADTGVAGALAINVGMSRAQATIANSATVTVTNGGAVELKAQNFTSNTVKASAKQEGGGSVGVGASIALNIGETDTDALLGNGATLSGSGSITIGASSSNAMTTTAEGGSAGDTAVTPVVSISVSDNETLASTGTGAAVATTGAITLSAQHEGSVATVAEGSTESGSTGVGISLALSIGTDIASATVARNLTAGGAIGLSARNVSSNSGKAKASVAGGDNDAPAEGSEDAEEGGINKKVKGNRDFADKKAKDNGADSDAPTTEKASAEGEGGAKVQVAGAAAVTITSATSSAKINDGLTITAGNGSGVTDGVVAIKSEANADSEAIADASTVQEGEGGSGGTGIGIAVAVNVASVVNEAVLGNGTITADGVVVQALMAEVDGDSKHAFKAEATSGASGADTGIAGALAVNVGISRAQASIASNATVTITDGGAVELKAQNFTSNTVKASARQEGGGSVGVGASIALNIGETDTDALLGNNATLSGAGDITISAASGNAMSTTAEGGSAGETAVTPVVAISVSDNETVATTGTGSGVIASDTITLSAQHEGSVATVAEGSTEAGNTGVGISLALSIGTDIASATVARNLTAGGAISLSARNATSNSGKAKASVAGGDAEEAPEEGSADAEEGGVNKKVKGNRDFADKRAKDNGADSDAPTTDKASAEGEGGSKVQVAGAVAVTITSATSRAKINDGLTITAGNGTGVTDGTLTIQSEANADSEAVADAGTVLEGEGGGSSTGVGVAVSVNVADIVNEAVLGDSTITADGLVLQALMAEVDGDSRHAFKAEATSGASGAETGVAGALALNVGLSRTQAKVADNATVTITDDGAVELKAQNLVSNTVKATARQEGGGSVGVGASIALNIGETDTDALIGNGVVLTGAGDITLGAASSNAMATTAEGGSAGDTAITPVIAISVSDNDTQATLGTGGTLTLGGTLDVSASHNGSTFTDAAGDTESGQTGVGITIALAIGTDTALATTGRGIVADGDVKFAARTVSTNRSTARASVAGGEGESEESGGETGGDTGGEEETGATDQKVRKQEDFANQRSTAAGGDTASDTRRTDSASSNTSGGSVSVAGAVAVTVATSTSKAWLPEFTHVTAGANGGTGALVLRAENLTDATATADGSAVTSSGGTGVGVGIAVNVGTVTNQASVGAGSVIVADGLTVEALRAERDVEMTVEAVNVVDEDADTVFIGIGHGIKTGDQVTYQKGSGDAVGGLSDDASFYARVEDGGRISLYDTEEHAKAGGEEGRQALTGQGTGTGHTFEYGGLLGFGEEEVAFDGGQRTVIDLGEGHNLRTGDSITYHSGSGDALGGLVDGTTY